ncbi:uncharacterized protein K452DRAFT_55110 [Aplosporella prunicola CBS 121167]|uniref:Altered inheritance of mitochondria protein 6 n=1 Tax=Aplosporella prunicola CBS 121167 TaxID=1176127 RepID=A0A6A6BBU7_9PEZI|nr:uncharacterized protein K452DRAFT_55110 [Aplosporella prunicola CBS 121167]KAF2140387.1 hypothetical protein K452DRAFT_55110 [Aplosporella prunicola CBS 121167]
MKSLLSIPTSVTAAAAAAAAAVFIAKEVAAAPTGSGALQNILDNTHRSPLYGYPTDLTRGVIPKPFHSHNDYWRDVPFYSALSYGAVSVEADVWLVDGELYVGHHRSALTTARTLDALYIQPILDTLQRQNPTTQFTTGDEGVHGVFDTVPELTLYFFIDLKTDADATFAAVLTALEPLRARGYLTTAHANGTLAPGPVTVLGTGNTQLEQVLALSANESAPARDLFFDAPLQALKDDERVAGPEVAPIASVDFGSLFNVTRTDDVARVLSENQKKLLREQVETARERGIATRYWGLPDFPVGVRNAVWRVLVEEGVDLLNVDALEDAVELWG